MVENLCEEHVYPSRQTISRWNDLHNRLGHVRPCRRNGNGDLKTLQGSDLILLALYRVAYPKAKASEINSFLYQCNYGNVHFSLYSNSAITEAEQYIGLKRKRGSTMAYQAFLPVNVRKREIYWTMPYPLGIAGIRRRNIIDMDECGVYFKDADRRGGKAYVGVRVREPGPYGREHEKTNLLLAISGEPGVEGQPAWRWAETWSEGGTTIVRVHDFIQGILNDIGMGTPDNWYVFTMDNLNSHHNAAVVALIQAHGHGVVYRAPYYAVDGAIEFFFNTLQTMLRSDLHEIRNGNLLVQKIYQSIQSVQLFKNYFICWIYHSLK